MKDEIKFMLCDWAVAVVVTTALFASAAVVLWAISVVVRLIPEKWLLLICIAVVFMAFIRTIVPIKRKPDKWVEQKQILGIKMENTRNAVHTGILERLAMWWSSSRKESDLKERKQDVNTMFGIVRRNGTDYITCNGAIVSVPGDKCLLDRLAFIRDSYIAGEPIKTTKL